MGDCALQGFKVTSLLVITNGISHTGWLSSRVVSVLDTSAEWPGFKSQPRRLRQTVHIHRASVDQVAKLASVLLRVAMVTAGMAAYRRVYGSRYLQATAKNRDQLPNPTLGNRVWASFLLPHEADTRLQLCTLPNGRLAAGLYAYT